MAAVTPLGGLWQQISGIPGFLSLQQCPVFHEAFLLTHRREWNNKIGAPGSQISETFPHWIYPPPVGKGSEMESCDMVYWVRFTKAWHSLFNVRCAEGPELATGSFRKRSINFLLRALKRLVIQLRSLITEHPGSFEIQVKLPFCLMSYRWQYGLS